MRALALVVAAGLLGGCASIPESTPVEVVGENPGAGEQPTVGAPQPGLDPLSVVRRFVEASASHVNEHQAVRAYLTGDAGRNWNDAAVTYVLEDRFDTAPAPTPSTPDADQRRQVTLRTRQLGRLDRNGVFGLDRRELGFTVNVVKDGGEWRIANPPTGLLMRFVDFRSSYRVVGLSYVDASSDVLVNDRRWVLNRPHSALAGRVINLLLGEPSPDLATAVTSELRGARTRTNVALGPDNVLTVDLTDVQELNETQRQLAAAQIVRSIDEFVTTPVRILVDGEPLIRDQPVWRAADAQRFEPKVDVSPGLPGLVVTGGRVVKIGSGGELGGLPPLVESVAQSANGERLAVVTTDTGRPRLLVGPAGALRPVELAATTMSRPTWRRDRGEVWTVVDGNRLVAVLIDNGPPRVQIVEATELSRRGEISELRISRDGVRVAAVVNNELLLGSIVGVGLQRSVRNVRVLSPPNPAQLVDVDWFGTDQVVMATASRDTPVYEASVDGLNWRSFGTSNLTPPITRIAAVLDRPVLVADQTGVWSATSSNSVWQPIGHHAGSVPVYPG